MPIFRCSRCGAIENTALSNYWSQKYGFGDEKPSDVLCSECDPEIGKWHGCFPKDPADGFDIGEDGFLYHPDHKPHHTKIVGRVPGELKVTPREEPEFPEELLEGESGEE